jgi:hypothetical protein
MINECGADGGMRMGEKTKVFEKTWLSATSSTTNPT